MVSNDTFSTFLGSQASVNLLSTDTRAPFFYAGGTWIPGLSTLFLTSNLIRDPDPGAISSANRRTEITKLEFQDKDSVSRDKVRCPERSFMAAGCAVHPNSDDPAIIFCAQGSLQESAGLVVVGAKRPHKARMLLDNFHGRPFNSPCDIVTNQADHSVCFTDPAYGYEYGFRHKPQLPPGHIYRFDPESGDCRVLECRLSRPAGLAFSPDYSTLYVSEMGDKYGGTYIYAYDIMYSSAVCATPSSNNNLACNGTNGTSLSYGSGPSSIVDSSIESHGPKSLRTLNASPRGLAAALNIVERKTLSRSNSRSGSRSRDMTHHGLLSSLPFDQVSHSRGPTKLSATLPPATATSSLSYRAHGTFLANKRLFAYSPNVAPSGGISTDPVQGNLWLGTDEGVEVWSAVSGELMGKILVEDLDNSQPGNVKTTSMKGVSKVAFTSAGQAILFGGERVWRLAYG